MNIFLTGGTGFIGAHVLRQALAAGHCVCALRRPGSKPRIPLEQQPQWLDRAMDEVVSDDLMGCDVLVHLAAHSVSYPHDTLSNCLRWNLMAVLSLFEQARRAGIKRYVVAGSFFEYGQAGYRFHPIPTDAPLEPTNSYAVSKAAASIALRQWAEEHQLSLDILRVFHVFGTGESESRFWPTLRRAALTGADLPMTAGEQIRDFLPVEDVARVFLSQALEPFNPEQGVRISNLSSGKPSSLREFAEHWWQEFGARGKLQLGEMPYRAGEVMHYVPGPDQILVCETVGLNTPVGAS
jgi:nucleoside-diphosphate-sugar epimerase